MKISASAEIDRTFALFLLLRRVKIGYAELRFVCGEVYGNFFAKAWKLLIYTAALP